MTLYDLLQPKGCQEILRRALVGRFAWLVEEPANHDPKLEQAILHLLAQDMILLEALLQHLRILADKPELILQLLIHAYQGAKAPGTRRHVLKIAANFGLAQLLPAPETVSMDVLTVPQRTVFRELVALTELYYEQGLAQEGAPDLRIAPLVIAPSGSGKTHLVRLVGRSLGLPVVRMTVGDWIIRASKAEPSALQQLVQHLDTWPRFILFIDELDKIGRGIDRTDYTQHQQVEIFSVLDRDVTPFGTARGQWSPRHNEKLRQQVMLVGSGTWQDLWSLNPGRGMGFAAPTDGRLDITPLVRQARVIPEELLNRFSDRWLIIPPYSRDDFVQIADRLKLGPEDLDLEAAVATGTNFRAIQNALTARALRRHLARKSADPHPDVIPAAEVATGEPATFLEAGRTETRPNPE